MYVRTCAHTCTHKRVTHVSIPEGAERTLDVEPQAPAERVSEGWARWALTRSDFLQPAACSPGEGREPGQVGAGFSPTTGAGVGT